MATSKASASASGRRQMFGDSDTDRRVSGLADRRVNTSDYRYNEYPKMVYHKDGHQSRVVTDEAGMDALGGDWGEDNTPEIHQTEASHEAAVLKGDGVPRNLNVAKVEVVNPKDDNKAAAFQTPPKAVTEETAADEDARASGRSTTRRGEAGETAKANAKAEKAAAKTEKKAARGAKKGRRG